MSPSMQPVKLAHDSTDSMDDMEGISKAILNGEMIDLVPDDWDEPLPPTGIDVQYTQDEISASEAIGVSTSELIYYLSIKC